MSRRNELARQWADDLMEIQGLDPESLRREVDALAKAYGICQPCGDYNYECDHEPRPEEE